MAGSGTGAGGAPQGQPAPLGAAAAAPAAQTSTSPRSSMGSLAAPPSRSSRGSGAHPSRRTGSWPAARPSPPCHHQTYKFCISQSMPAYPFTSLIQSFIHTFGPLQTRAHICLSPTPSFPGTTRTREITLHWYMLSRRVSSNSGPTRKKRAANQIIDISLINCWPLP